MLEVGQAGFAYQPLIFELK